MPNAPLTTARDVGVAAVRWLFAFRAHWPRDANAIRAAVEWELTRDAERAAEPLWRGRTLLARARVGLAYTADAVRIVRSHDCWSEANDGALTLRASRPLRAWRRWDAFARTWNARQPDHHGEAWLRRGVAPVAVAVDGALLEAADPAYRAVLEWRARTVAEAAGLRLVVNTPCIWRSRP